MAFMLAIELPHTESVRGNSLLFLARFSVFVLGGYFSRYIPWGCLVGSILGGVVGFYGLLMLLIMFCSGMNYEQSIPLLFASTGLGVAIGCYVFSTLIKKNARR